MILDKLKIERKYDFQNSKYVLNGDIYLIGESSSVRLKITDDLCKKIICLCSDSIVEVANETSKLLKAEILEQVSMIENLKDK